MRVWGCSKRGIANSKSCTWVVVKTRVPFWGTLNIRYRILLGTPKRDYNFDNHPHMSHIRFVEQARRAGFGPTGPACTSVYIDIDIDP